MARPKKYLTKTRKARLKYEIFRELGSKGGKARSKALTPEQRKASAIKASKAAVEARRKKAL